VAWGGARRLRAWHVIVADAAGAVPREFIPPLGVTSWHLLPAEALSRDLVADARSGTLNSFCGCHNIQQESAASLRRVREKNATTP